MRLMVMATREFDSLCRDYPVVADRITTRSANDGSIEPRQRRSRKNARMSSPHSRSSTPPVTSAR